MISALGKVMIGRPSPFPGTAGVAMLGNGNSYIMTVDWARRMACVMDGVAVLCYSWTTWHVCCALYAFVAHGEQHLR